MSNRRVKALDYDEDDIYDDGDYDDYDEGGGEVEAEAELSPEDKEQMRLGTIKVREALGSLSSSVSDKAIQDALWHYYYDISQSVIYIKSESNIFDTCVDAY